MAEAVDPITQNPLVAQTGNSQPVNVPDNNLINVGLVPLPTIETPSNVPEGIANMVNSTTASSPVIDLNRALYSNEFLKSITETASTIQSPKVKAQTFDNLGLSEPQTELLNQTSQNIANQTNQVINTLQQSFIDSINAIEQASQDRAITSGRIVGELGSPAETSTRNLSFVADAQARGQQQVLDTTQDFLNQVQQAFFAGQESQIQVGQQGLELQLQDIQAKQAEANRLTQALGELYVVNKQGNIIKQLDESGSPIPTLTGKGFELEARQAELGAKQSQLNIAAKQFENSQLFVTDELGNYLEPTEYGQLLLENQISQQQLNQLSLEQQQQYLQGLQGFMSSSKQINDIYNNLLSDDTNLKQEAYNQISELQEQNGSAFMTYWSTTESQIKTDADGNVTGITAGVPVYNTEGLGTLGLFLNSSFNSPAYLSAVADMKESERPDYLFSEDVKQALMEGDTVNSLNKLYLESNDGNVILMGLKNTDQSGENYKFKIVDTSRMSELEKNELKSKLGQIDQTNPLALQKAVDTLVSQTNAVATDLGASEFIEAFLNNSVNDSVKQKLNDDYKSKVGEVPPGTIFGVADFSQAKNNKMTDYLPKNSELLPLVLAGIDRGTFQILQDEKIIDPDNLSIAGLNIITSTTLNPMANTVSNGKGLTGIRNDEIKLLGTILRGETARFEQNLDDFSSSNLITFSDVSGDNNNRIARNANLADSSIATDVQEKVNALAQVRQQLNAKVNPNNDAERMYYDQIFQAIILASSPQQNMQEAVALTKIVDSYLGIDIDQREYYSPVTTTSFIPSGQNNNFVPQQGNPNFVGPTKGTGSITDIIP